MALDDDQLPESGGQIRVTLNNDPATISTYTVANQIEDVVDVTVWDDDAPELIILGGNSVAEADNAKATFRLISNVRPKAPIPVQYTPTGAGFINGSGVPVTATPPISFVRNNWSGNYEGVLEFDILNDNIDEPNGSVTVALRSESVPTTYYVGAQSRATVAVSDDDPVPTILISNLKPSVNEDATELRIPIQLSNPSQNKVEIAWRTSTGTATAGDFTARDETLEIAAGETLGLIVVPINDDSIYDPNETFNVILDSPNETQGKFLVSQRDINDSTKVRITITINDNEVLPTIRFANKNVTVLEDSSIANLELSLSTSVAYDVSVDYLTTAGTATAGLDFKTVPASPASTVTIPAGSVTAAIDIEILTDDINEQSERFSVTISNPQNAILSNAIADSTASITITDQDIPGLSIIAGSKIKEGVNTTADFTLVSDIMPSGGITVYYTPVSDSFLPTGISTIQQMSAQPLVFSQATSTDPITATLSVPIDDDLIKEANGSIMVTLQDEPSTTVTYFALTNKNVASVSVEDDDAIIPVLAIAADSAGVIETADVAEFTVTAYSDQTKTTSIDPGRAITIRYIPTEVDGADFLLDSVADQIFSEELEFAASGGIWTATFAVPIVDDNNGEPSGEINVALLADAESVTTYNLSTGTDQSANIRIWDDEIPALNIVGGPTVTEGVGVKATFKVVSNVQPESDIKIRYTPEGSAFLASPGTTVKSANPLQFDFNSTTGKYESSVAIDIVNDTLDEPDGTVSLTLVGDDELVTTYYIGTTAKASVSVTDDDLTPTISVANLEQTFAEDADIIVLPVTLSNPTTKPVTIEWSTIAGTALDRDFLEQINQTLEISASTQTEFVTTGDIRVRIFDDEVYESQENFQVRISGVTNASFASGVSNIQITVNITDNDTEPVLTLASAVTVLESEGNASISATLSNASGEPVTFNYSTTTGTAIGADFTEQTGSSHTISAGDVSMPLLIPITADAINEFDEQFTVTFANLSGASYSGGNSPTVTVTIRDDDSALFSVADSMVTEGDTGTVDLVFNVSLSNPMDRTTSLTWTALTKPGNTATAGVDYAVATNTNTGSLAFAIGDTSKSIRVPITGDTLSEANETFTITLSGASNGANFADAIAIGTIVDNETDPTIAVTAPTSVEEDAGNLVITATLSKVSGSPVTMNLTTTDGTATGTGA